MKIVHIEEFFHPDAGYQINIIAKYMAAFGHEVIIYSAEPKKVPSFLTDFFGRENIAEKDREYEIKYKVNIKRFPLWGYHSGRAIFSNLLYKELRKEQADVIYVHGNDSFTGMRLLLKRKQFAAPLIMDSHMLEMASKNKFSAVFKYIYRKIFTPIIKKEGITVIRTQDDQYVEKCLGIPLKQAPWISVGSDTMLFHPDQAVRDDFRKKHNIPLDAFVILYAGKMTSSKGGMLLAETIKEKFITDKNLFFIIIGNTSGEYGIAVEDKFKESQNTVLRFPTQKYEALASFYSAADVALFPAQCSLSFYDVQASGLPVIFENNNINIQRAQFGNAIVFECGDINDFRAQIQKVLDMEPDNFSAMKQSAVEYILENYDYKKITERYIDCIDRAITKYRRSN